MIDHKLLLLLYIVKKTRKIGLQDGKCSYQAATSLSSINKDKVMLSRIVFRGFRHLNYQERTILKRE
jgi:hypothetical protein